MNLIKDFIHYFKDLFFKITLLYAMIPTLLSWVILHLYLYGDTLNVLTLIIYIFCCILINVFLSKFKRKLPLEKQYKMIEALFNDKDKLQWLINIDDKPGMMVDWKNISISWLRDMGFIQNFNNDIQPVNERFSPAYLTEQAKNKIPIIEQEMKKSGMKVTRK